MKNLIDEIKNIQISSDVISKRVNEIDTDEYLNTNTDTAISGLVIGWSEAVKAIVKLIAKKQNIQLDKLEYMFFDAEGKKTGYSFYCPGCKQRHGIVTMSIIGGAIWQFNRDLVKPTVNPSIKVEMQCKDKVHICHSFIKDGYIQYLNDCTHELAGKTVELPDITELIISE